MTDQFDVLRCPSCKHLGDAVGSSGHTIWGSTKYRCPQCDCEWASTNETGQIHSEKYKRFEDVDRLARDDDVLSTHKTGISRIDDRIDRLEALVKRIATHLGIDE